MHKAILGGLFGTFLFAGAASAACSVTNSFSTGNIAYASQVNQNFTDITSCAAPLASPSFTGNVVVTGTSGYEMDLEGSVGAALRIHATGTGNANIALDRYGSGTTANTAITFYTNGSADFQEGVGIGVSGVFAIYDNVTSTFPIAITESNGEVGINTSSPSYTLHVNGSVAGTSAYNNLSDARLKKNITPIHDALSIVTQLQGVRFNWRTPDERTVGKDFSLPVDQPQIGFIAQDVKSVLPEAVSVAKGPDAVMSMAESKIVPVLVEALKELKAANDHQSAEIKQLQTQVSTLERDMRIRTARK